MPYFDSFHHPGTYVSDGVGSYVDPTMIGVLIGFVYHFEFFWWWCRPIDHVREPISVQHQDPRENLAVRACREYHYIFLSWMSFFLFSFFKGWYSCSSLCASCCGSLASKSMPYKLLKIVPYRIFCMWSVLLPIYFKNGDGSLLHGLVSEWYKWTGKSETGRMKSNDQRTYSRTSHHYLSVARIIH